MQMAKMHCDGFRLGKSTCNAVANSRLQYMQAQKRQSYTVKRFRLYFNHILGNSVVFLLWVCDTSSWRSAYSFNRFVKLASPFRKSINWHFWWGLLFLWSYISQWYLPEFLGCMVCGRNAWDVIFWKKILANVTNWRNTSSMNFQEPIW